MEKPLYILPAKKWKGLTVYCYKCKTNVSDMCKETGKPLQRCPFGDRHAFKVYVHVPGTDNSRKTKKLDTRDVNEAIRQAMEFEKEVKANTHTTEVRFDNKKVSGEDENVPRLLIHALSWYSGFLHNENVPTHLQVERSKDFIKDIERKLQLLVVILKKKGYDISSFRIEDLNDKVVGDVVDYLKKESNYSPTTYNKFLNYANTFLKCFSEEFYPVKAWFKRVPKQPAGSNPPSITQEEIEALLKITTPENGIEHYENGVKEFRNFYRPYIKDAFRLAELTGSRREELINLKYSGITIKEDGTGYIKVENYKVNRIQKRKDEKYKKYVYIPLTKSLRKLLDEFGYEKYKSTDNYILAPETKDKRNKVMSDLLSRAFTHYYDQLNTGRKLTFKSFRKTYITQLKLYMGGGNIKDTTGHSNENVIEKYYLDREAIALSVSKDFEPSTTVSKRKEVLEQVRNSSISKEKTQEVEI
jgi:integrase